MNGINPFPAERVDYNMPRNLIIQAIASSALIVFYTTKNSYLESFLSPDHWIIFGFTWLLMIFVSLMIGFVSSFLDRKLSWRRHTRLRYLLQFVLGVVLICVICYFAANLIFKWVFGIDLSKTQYLTTDFVFVCVSIVLINIYQYYLYHHTNNVKKFYARMQQVLSGQKEQTAANDQEQTAQKLDLLKIIDSENAKMYFALDSGEPIPATTIGLFYVKGEKNEKFSPNQVYIRNFFGEEHALFNANSLIEIEQEYQYLFIRVCRNWLVNRHAIVSSKKMSYRKYELTLNVPHVEKRFISKPKHELIELLLATKNQSDKGTIQL